MKMMGNLVARAKIGDQDAIKVLYEHSYKQVFYTVRSMVSDEDTALDLTQDAFIKAFSSLENLGDPNKFTAWTKVIGRNLTLNYLKAKKPILFSEVAPEGADDDYELPFEDTNQEHMPEVVMDQNETRRLIREILGTLSESQRLAVGMFYYENMSVKEIAGQTGMSESSVKVHLHNGRKRIEEKVKELEKQGTKLYSIAPLPFLLLLFRLLSKNFDKAADPAADTVIKNLSSGSKAASAKDSVKANVETSGKEAAKTAAKSAAGKSAGGAAAFGNGKIAGIIIGCAVGAAAIAAGTIIAVNAVNNKHASSEGAAQTQTVMNAEAATNDEGAAEIPSETLEPETTEAYPDSVFPEADEVLSQIYEDMASENYVEAATLLKDNRNTLWNIYTEAGYEGIEDQIDQPIIGQLFTEGHMFFIPDMGSRADLEGIETAEILGIYFMPDDGSNSDINLRAVAVKDGQFSFLNMSSSMYRWLVEGTLSGNSLINAVKYRYGMKEEIEEIELTAAYIEGKTKCFPYNGKVTTYGRAGENSGDIIKIIESKDESYDTEYTIYYKDGAFDWDAMDANGGVFYTDSGVDDPEEFAASTNYSYIWDSSNHKLYYHITIDGAPDYRVLNFPYESDRIWGCDEYLPGIWEEMDAHVIR